MGQNCFVKRLRLEQSRTIKYAPAQPQALFAHFIKILRQRQKRMNRAIRVPKVFAVGGAEWRDLHEPRIHRNAGLFNKLSVSRGMLIPLLPFGLSSPVSPPHRKCFRRGPRNEVTYSQNAGLTLDEYQNFWYRTYITKRRTALTEGPARAEEFGTRTLTPVST